MITRHTLLLAMALALCVLAAPPGAAQEAENGLQAVIIGSGSPQYDPDRAGPGVLIKLGDTSVLIDTGNGAQARLEQEGVQIRDLDGLFFTHQHLDHNEEFIPLFIRALLGGNRFLVAGPAPMARMVKTTLDLYRKDIEYRLQRSGRKFEEVKDNATVRELIGGDTFALGGIQVTTAKVNHTIETTAFRFDAGGRSIVISGDLTYSASLSALARDADILIMDSGGTIKQAGSSQRRSAQTGETGRGGRQGAGGAGANQRAHVTLEETARIAGEAKVKTLVLTHFTPGAIDEAATIAELRKGYAGPILFAADGMALPGASGE